MDRISTFTAKSQASNVLSSNFKGWDAPKVIGNTRQFVVS